MKAFKSGPLRFAYLLHSTIVAEAVVALPVDPIIPRDTAELYIFANCINNVTLEAYAAIFWYYPDFLPDYPTPQLTAYVNNQSSVQYAGQTTAVTAPFKLKASIPYNATAAIPGTLLATNASASSFAGPMAVFKGDRNAFYEPDLDVNCYEEYYQHDYEPVGSD